MQRARENVTCPEILEAKKVRRDGDKALTVAIKTFVNNFATGVVENCSNDATKRQIVVNAKATGGELSASRDRVQQVLSDLMEEEDALIATLQQKSAASFADLTEEAKVRENSDARLVILHIDFYL